jgi:hypothetical protein
MTPQHALQLVAAVISSITPLLVVSVVYAVAARHGRDSATALAWPHAGRWLTVATAVALVVTGVTALLLPAPSAVAGAVNLSVFALLAVPGLLALHAIDAASQPSREITVSTREATLAPRRAGDYLPWASRGLLYAASAAGVGLFLWRAASPSPGREWMVPGAFALAAMAFLWLYEVWIHQIITGPGIAAQTATARRRSARRIFSVEIVLITVCLALAHALLNLDWTTDAIMGAALAFVGAIAGVFGCAFALASGVYSRRYAPVTDGAGDRQRAAVR